MTAGSVPSPTAAPSVHWQARLPVFYGWVIVLAGLSITMVMYGVIETFGIMFKPLALDCRWDRGTVSAASFVNWIAFGASSLACGALSDRFGSQRVMLGGAIIFVAVVGKAVFDARTEGRSEFTPAPDLPLI